MRPGRAFSLLEVVLAVGVFALGIVVVIGLFVPVTKSVGHSADAAAASQLGAAIRAELQQRARRSGSLSPVIALLNSESDATPAPAGDAPRLFASRDGAKIGEYGASAWGATDEEKFFEVTLIRHPTLSPAAEDAEALLVVYTARIRWPAFVADSNVSNRRRAVSAAEAGVGQQVLFLPGSVRR